MNYQELKTLMADKQAWNDIMQKTSVLEKYYKYVPARQRLWHYERNSFDTKKCDTCGTNVVGFNQRTKTYGSFCSSKCAHASDAVREKTKTTCLKKFGVTSNLCLPENKKKETETKLKKYGVAFYTQTEEYRQRCKETCLNKYGVDSASKSQIVKDKIDETNYRKYGRKRSSQIHIPDNVMWLKDDKQEMSRWFNDLKMPVTEIAAILGVNHSQLCVHFKNNLGIDITRHIVSMHERQISDFLTSAGIVHTLSNRSIISPKELDIVIEDQKIAIEINGLAWHSELRGKDKHYHINKSLLCKDKGYRVIHIWTTEWDNQQDLVKSRLLSILGQNKSIMARKCQISEISAIEASAFLQKNHIQGDCVASVKIGLTFSNQLVAIMTFGKSRYAKSVEWELIRYCSLAGVNVIGGAGKLFSSFKSKYLPSSVISYCDRRWNSGKLYEKIGFTLSHTTSPNYWYTKKYTALESRIKFQKHKLVNLLPKFNPVISEWENMVANGYDRVWDCGNFVYLWKSN